MVAEDQPGEEEDIRDETTSAKESDVSVYKTEEENSSSEKEKPKKLGNKENEKVIFILFYYYYGLICEIYLREFLALPHSLKD